MNGEDPLDTALDMHIESFMARVNTDDTDENRRSINVNIAKMRSEPRQENMKEEILLEDSDPVVKETCIKSNLYD